MAEIKAGQPTDGTDPTATDVAIEYAKYARSYYRKRSKLSSEFHAVQQGLRELRKLYGDTPAREFGPMRFKTVRKFFLGRGLVAGPHFLYQGL